MLLKSTSFAYSVSLCLAVLHGLCEYTDLTWLTPVKDTLEIFELDPFPTALCSAGKLLFLKEVPNLSSLSLSLSLCDGHGIDEDKPPLDALHIEAIAPPSKMLPNLT